MSKVIQETKDHLKRLFPRAQDVDVKVNKDPDGSFISKIHVRTSGRIFHAMKRDPHFRKSLNKTFHAVLSQIRRIKARRKKSLSELRVG